MSSDTSVPKMMTAVRMYEFGGPEVLKVEKHPVPQPGPDEVLVAIKATTISGWDVSYRTGKVNNPIPGRPPLPIPQQLGREAAGDVVAVGPAVKRFKLGDRVIMLSNPACGHCPMCVSGLDNVCISTSLPGQSKFGSHAEYIAVPESELLRAPEHLSYETLACIIWAYSTVWHMIDSRAKLVTGESVLITGASGNMGIAAIHLAKIAGANPIIALSAVPEKKDAILRAGADVVLNYKDGDIEQQIRRHVPGGLGVDIVIDNVGGSMAKLGINVVKMGGRVVLVAVMAGASIDLNITQVFVKNVSIMGSRASTRKDQQLMLQLVTAGKISPLIGKVMKLSESVEAAKLMDGGEVVGRIVLVP